jgi:hypothetical protein
MIEADLLIPSACRHEAQITGVLGPAQPIENGSDLLRRRSA